MDIERINQLNQKSKNKNKYKTYCQRCNLNFYNYSYNTNCPKCGNKLVEQESTTQKHIPKCPVCGSSEINAISYFKRGSYGIAFGLFSKTARSQWECKNCGNKF